MSANGFAASRAGTVFRADSGKLYVFTTQGVSVMIAWPRPMAWKKTRERPVWAHYRPVIHLTRRDCDRRRRREIARGRHSSQLQLPLDLPPPLAAPPSKDTALQRWQETIPFDIADLVARYTQRQWHMLALLARCGGAARDLVESNPALAFALASNWVYHRPAVHRPLRSARALLRTGRRQREILAWLGFPATESARKILSRVVSESLSIPRLLYLRQAMADAGLDKTLRHLPRLNTGAIRIVTDPELLALAAPTLLREVAVRRAEDHRPAVARLLKDCLEMWTRLHPDGRRPPRLRELATLEMFHAELIDRFLRQPAPSHYLEPGLAFPPPPVPGTDAIVPITSASELVAEGVAQRNCVGSYLARVVKSKACYIYRVLRPERCTLALARCGDRWIPSEMSKACNQRPSAETFRAVEKWLADRFKDATMPESWGLDYADLPF